MCSNTRWCVCMRSVTFRTHSMPNRLKLPVQAYLVQLSSSDIMQLLSLQHALLMTLALVLPAPKGVCYQLY